ncbi:lipid phosphate phosphatase gamma-like [Rutidosis leptorrhynchoides]|uniref:lipid phosphate phosphatase gamma-like n=1 Tax=Rutidosis leptorrhynchoides TaxID=125765 RepID=UPI003A998674
MSNHLRAVTLTHVRYEKGDQLGHFLAWISLIPVFITFGGFISHFIFRRELQGMFFALGLLISHLISELIKLSVKEARPETCILLESCDSHGWPSSHSQYMFFFAIYFTLLTYKKYGIILRRQMWVAFVVIWPLAILTMYSRVYLGYHTIGQVFAGASLGFTFGGVWFWVVNGKIKGSVFRAIEESSVGRLFYIKDTSHIPNLLEFDYENARAARRHPSYKRSE